MNLRMQTVHQKLTGNRFPDALDLAPFRAVAAVAFMGEN
jgi:hypothetical protein